ncbi:MAG: hypothetical protein LBT46_15415 [Planctomycetaceae bacterium]|jgi:hypothetical protein|nr:hypothetical protein [Planctomycetaceae bacterium]
MTTTLSTTLVLTALTAALAAGQLELVQPAVERAPGTSVSVDDLAEVQTAESERNADDTGYTANEAVSAMFDWYQYLKDGAVIPFRLLRPAVIEEGKEYPLIVYFGGRGEMNGDNDSHLAHLHHAFKTLSEKDFYLLAVQHTRDGVFAYDGEDHVAEDFFIHAPGGGTYFDAVNEIYDILLAEFPVDKTRVSVAGICSGSTAAYMFASQHKEHVAAMCIVSGYPPGVNIDGIALAAYNSPSDDRNAASSMRQYVTAKKRKGEVFFLNDTMSGHADTSLPFGEDNILDWLLAQKKGQPVTLPCFHLYPVRSWLAVSANIVLPLVCFAALLHFRRQQIRRRKKTL